MFDSKAMNQVFEILIQIMHNPPNPHPPNQVFESLIQIMHCAGFEFRVEADGESVVLPQVFPSSQPPNFPSPYSLNPVLEDVVCPQAPPRPQTSQAPIPFARCRRLRATPPQEAQNLRIPQNPKAQILDLTAACHTLQGASQYVLGEMKSLCEMELRRISPEPVSSASASSSPAEAFDRETAVFTRVDGGIDPSRIQVPDSFFEFTGQDLKASTSMSGVHMTRTMKEAMKPQFKFALIRVRFTDGYILQGKFRAGEKVEAIKAWVEGCLNTPERMYTLSTMPPVRKITGRDVAGKTVNELGLAPGQSPAESFWTDARIRPSICAWSAR